MIICRRQVWLMAVVGALAAALMGLHVFIAQAAPGPAPILQARPTNTPQPDGSIVYIVQEGDTLLGIAIEYDLSVEELLALNNISADEFIVPGQTLIVRAPGIAPTAAPATETPAVATPTPNSPAATAPPPPAIGQSQLCIITYFDQNSNGQRDSAETLLPNAQTEVVLDDKTIASGKTDGSNPQCLNDLEPGSYLVRQDSPAGYKITTVPNWLVPLAAGQSITIEFGHVLSGEAELTPTPTPADDNRVGRAALISGGVVVFLLLLGAGLWVITQRT